MADLHIDLPDSARRAIDEARTLDPNADLVAEAVRTLARTPPLTARHPAAPEASSD